MKRGCVCAVKFAVASTLRTRKTTTTKEEATQMKITGAQNGRGAIAGRATTAARRGTLPGTAEDELGLLNFALPNFSLFWM